MSAEPSSAARCACVVTVVHADQETKVLCPNDAVDGNGGYCDPCTTEGPCWKGWDE